MMTTVIAKCDAQETKGWLKSSGTYALVSLVRAPILMIYVLYKKKINAYAAINLNKSWKLVFKN